MGAAGHDAGPETIAHHLNGSVSKLPSVATVWRILKRNGLIAPQPHKLSEVLVHPIRGPAPLTLAGTDRGRDFLDRAGLRADSSSQRALSALEAAEKFELGPDGWQVSDPLFALWLARGGITVAEGE